MMQFEGNHQILKGGLTGRRAGSPAGDGNPHHVFALNYELKGGAFCVGPFLNRQMGSMQG